MEKKKDEENRKRFPGEKLLKLPQFDSRAARVVLKPDGLYSFQEAEKAVAAYMRKKG